MVRSLSLFFVDKVQRVREAAKSLINASTEHITLHRLSFSGAQLMNFDHTTVAEVRSIIESMPNKSSPCDILPTSLLKDCADVFAPLIVHLTNLSFDTGIFPSAYKMAQVTPLLKKPGLCKLEPGSYRPISNLNTISKIIEKIVLRRLLPHLSKSDNFNQYQSAYRAGHSTETALMRMLNSWFTAIDNKQLVVLVSLDISAAFDTVNHDILLNRLRLEFGINGLILSWLKSYLTERKQYIKLGRHISSSTTTVSGVPQGSVLGPLLFATYVSPVKEVINENNVEHSQYADDTQLFLAIRAATVHNDLSVISKCAASVRIWLAANDLLLNADKSEVMLIGTTAQLKAVSDVKDVDVAGANLPVVSELKSLGVVIDRRLAFDGHIKSVCKLCNYHLWALRHIRNVIPLEVAEMIACSMIGARLDYCNAVLYGVSTSNLSKLQRIQNLTARIVLQQSKSSHVKPLLRSLHWLPVQQRITYKLAVLTYKARISRQPQYLSCLLSDRLMGTEMTLRSSTQEMLQVPSMRTQYGCRAFKVAAPTVWNSLPLHVKQSGTEAVFRNRLKTYLFSSAYDT